MKLKRSLEQKLIQEGIPRGQAYGAFGGKG